MFALMANLFFQGGNIMERKGFSEGQIAVFIIVNIVMLVTVAYASTSVTVEFFGGIGEGTIKRSNFLLGLMNDAGKYFFPMLIPIAMVKRRFFLATILVCFTILTMVLSFFASQAQDLNLAAAQYKKAVVNDEGYQMNKSTFELSTSYMEELRAEKAELKSVNIEDKIDNDSTIIALQNEYEIAKKKNWISTRPPYGRGTQIISGDIESRKAEIRQEHKQRLLDIDSQIKDQSTKAEKAAERTTNFDGVEATTTEGYQNLSEYLGIQVGDVAKYKNILLELLGVVLSATLGMLLGNRIEMFESIKGYIFSGIQSLNKSLKSKTAVESAPIGFKQDKQDREEPESHEPSSVQPSGILESDIKQYLDFMYNEEHQMAPGVSPGTTKISKNIDSLSTEDCRKIRNYLERKQVVQSAPGQTNILVDKKTAQNILKV
jgi:hypothetical protein